MTRPGDAILEGEALIRAAVARLRAGILALVFAMLGGSGLALATAWLVVQGGPNVGQHLQLLRNYLPGYTVTWPGALLGFAYGALLGAVVGWTTGWHSAVQPLAHPLQSFSVFPTEGCAAGDRGAGRTGGGRVRP